jgi:hypothetical protein
MDPLPSHAYVYRPLKKGNKGWDVLALQTALNVGRDGDFGAITDAAVRGYQDRTGLTVDGIAGVVTQRSLCLHHIWPAQEKNQTPPGLMRGQVEKESGFILGNHSAMRDNKTWDVGPCQRNTQYVSIEAGFDVPGSVAFLGLHLRRKHDEYRGYGKVNDERRLWELAAGSWNAPAWADRLAKGLTLSESQTTWLEAYIDRVCVYLKIT